MWKGTGYGSFEWKGQTWPVQEAVRQLNQSLSESPLKPSFQEQPYQIYTLVNHHCLHYETFNFYANAGRFPLRFEYPPLEANGQGIDMDYVYEGADALVAKRGGYLGPEFSIPGLREAIQILCDPHQDTVFGFQKIHSYPLPDGDLDGSLDQERKIQSKK